MIAVDGVAAADLAVLGVDTAASGLLRRLDPRPPARRLRAAWRVGRLRSALPDLATDLVERIDDDLAAVPALDEPRQPRAARRAAQRPARRSSACTATRRSPAC